SLGRECGSSDCCDHGNSAANQVGRQRWQSIGSIIGPAIFDRHVLAIDKARLLQALVECAQLIPGRMNRCRVEESHHRHHWLLRARRYRPRDRRAADERDELASPHVGPRFVPTKATPRTEGITERTAGPWATAEMF